MVRMRSGHTRTDAQPSIKRQKAPLNEQYRQIDNECDEY